jgi:DNA-binding transcriptional LysR family regulator
MDMPRQLPPLNALRAFEAAGRHQSFSRAADELGVSHSAISKHVRGLEGRLGAQLFRDASRGVELTQDGAAYLAQLTPAFDTIAEASEAFDARPEGAVTVNVETVFALKWLVPHLKEFKDLYPDISLHLDATEVVIDISRYEAEVAIRFFLAGAPGGRAVLLSDAPIYPYAAPAIADQIGDDPARLLEFELLRDRGGNPWARWFEQIGRSDLALQVPDTRRIRAMLAIETVLAEQGVLLASAENIQADEAAGRLVRVFDQGFRQGSYHMLFGEGVLRRKPVRLFRDWVVERTAEFRSEEAGKL